MYVTYFDEVKADPANGQVCYFVGGISVPMALIPDIEGKLSELATEVFGSSDLSKTTEFHSSDIYAAKAAFKGRAVDQRLMVFERLAAILSDNQDIKRAYAAIDTSKLYPANVVNAPQIAFQMFCERVQGAVGYGNRTLMIGDRDDEQMRSMIADFQRFRTRKTDWAYGFKITSIVDTVHFAQSHHSRLIQLADAYLFLTVHGWGTRKGWMAGKLAEVLKDKELWANAYKHWPP